VYAVVDYEDAYVEPRILVALRKHIPQIQIVRSADDLPADDPSIKVVTWSAYEKIPFESLMQRPESMLSCAYIIRKALIRKHHLALTARHHTAKHPASILATAIPTTNDFELDFAEFLDEALQEAYELSESLASNETLTPEERKWWILKPGMSDRGQGIRLFSTMEELQEIFESWEEDSDSEDEDGEGEGGEDGEQEEEEEGGDGVMTSQLRHFVAQSYIHPPLLISNRKFHIRTYVLAVGGLRVYVYKHMLALFAETPYSPPWVDEDLTAHLTNTCLQSGERVGSVRLFWEEELQRELGEGTGEKVWRDVCNIVGEIFEAAARGMRVHFQVP
jgi:tubulin--tyrosine ligase